MLYLQVPFLVTTWPGATCYSIKIILFISFPGGHTFLTIQDVKGIYSDQMKNKSSEVFAETARTYRKLVKQTKKTSALYISLKYSTFSS